MMEPVAIVAVGTRSAGVLGRAVRVGDHSTKAVRLGGGSLVQGRTMLVVVHILLDNRGGARESSVGGGAGGCLRDLAAQAACLRAKCFDVGTGALVAVAMYLGNGACQEASFEEDNTSWGVCTCTCDRTGVRKMRIRRLVGK